MTKTLKIGLLFIIISTLISIRLYSQTSVNGTLKDQSDNSTLIYANIAILKQNDSTFLTGTTTNELGQFKFSIADTGQYIMRISYLGYGTQILPLTINSREKTKNLGILKIEKAGQQLKEVQIVAQKPMYSYEGEKKIYNVSEDISIQDGVATDALQNAPGVYVDMEGNITLRGVSGVEIWLNDKPSRIKAEGLKSFLQQLPANSIEKIEVITNPSARYGAEGKGGIINIVTNKKIKNNQLFSAGIRGNTNNTYSPWASYIIGNEKISFNTYINYNSFEFDSESSNISHIMNEYGDTVYNSNSKSESKSQHNGYYGHLNLTWNINNNNTFDIWAGMGEYNGKSDNSSQKIKQTFIPYADFFDYNHLNNSKSTNFNIYSGLNFEHKFKKEGHYISFDGSYYTNDNKSNSSSTQNYTSQPWMNYSYQNIDNTSPSNSGSLLTTYVNHITKSRFVEAGGEISYSINSLNAPIDTLNFTTQEYIRVPLFSNIFKSKNITANTFATYSDTIWKISYKVGVRYEYAQTSISSIALSNELSRHYNSIFPTLHLNTRTKNNGNFSLSYSRRINYPENFIDPFVHRVNKESISAGNPYLDPEYTDAYEFSYGHFFKKGNSITASLYHKRTKLSITNFSDVIFDSIQHKYLPISTYVNAGNNIFTGADLTFSWIPIKDYRLMLNLNAYKQYFEADFEKYSVNTNNFTYDAKLIFNIKYKFLRLNIMGIYQAPKKTFQGSTKSQFTTNATVSADFFKKKLSIRVGMRDIFNTSRYDSDTYTPTIISIDKSKSKSQIVNFGVTLRLGKIELEGQQRQPINEGSI